MSLARCSLAGIALAGVAAMSGCAEDAQATVAPADFDAAVRAQYCTALVACGEVRDAAMCDRLDVPAEWPHLTAQDRADLASGAVAWDGEAAARCVHQAPSCDRTSRAAAPACEPLLVGDRGDGEACRRDEMCASGACNAPSCPNACCTGICLGDARHAPAHLGESCAGTTCLDGRCDADRCVAFQRPGEHCTADAECASGAACRRASGATDGTCVALPATGEPCTGECAQRGDICASATLTCMPGGTEGAACANDADCLALYRCTGIPDGRCERVEAAIGEACGYLPCERGAVCSLTCTAAPPPLPTCP